MLRRSLVLLAPASLLLVAACSEESRDSIESAAEDVGDDAEQAIDDTKRDAAELVARNLATEQGESEFDNAGNPLDGKLECTAKVADDVDRVDVSCNGTTQDGKKAVLEGQTNEIPGASVTSLTGTFTGTVDGEEVFSVEQLGG